MYTTGKKVVSENKFFMDITSIRECIMSMKIKNSEGFDRIPQRVLIDGCECLLDPMASIQDNP